MISHLIPLALLAAASGAAPKTTAFVDVSVLPMDRETVLVNQTVVVRDGKIVSIGAAKKVPIPKGAQKIDGRGKFLMPGLVEMHAHLNSAPELPLYLANGVTTVYNLNGAPGHLAWRKNIADGKLDGPRIVTCGPTVYSCETAEAGRRIAQDYAKAGYDAIKIYNNVTREAFFALTSTAKELGLLTVGHIPRAVGLEGVVEAKMAIAHAEEFLYTYMRESGSPETVAKAVQMTSSAGVPVTPTLIAFDHIIRQGKDLEKHLSLPEMRYLPPWSRVAWGPGRNRYQTQFASEQSQANLTRMFRIQQNLVKELFKGGVKIVTGTDSMNPGIVPGFCIAEEVVQLHEAGLSRYQALRAVTAVPAEVLRRGQEFGRVRVGLSADLVLLNANPLIDLSALNSRSGVMANGRWHSKPALRKRLAGLHKEYANLLNKGLQILKTKPGDAATYLQSNDPKGAMKEYLFATYLKRNGDDAFGKLIAALRASEKNAELASEESVNELGYWLLQSRTDRPLSIKVFARNVADFPKSANAYDSLAEGYLENGDKAKAFEFYRKALELDPTLESSKEALKRLTGG